MRFCMENQVLVQSWIQRRPVKIEYTITCISITNKSIGVKNITPINFTQHVIFCLVCVEFLEEKFSALLQFLSRQSSPQ